MVRVFAAAFVVLVSQGPAITPPNVDFSGSWTLAGDAKTGVLGRSVKLTQTATTLTIERSDMPAEMYTLNGETRTTYPPPGDQVTRNPETTLWLYVTMRISASGWAGNQLVIVTHQFNRANMPGANPREFDAEWTTQLKLHIDSDGHLVIQRDVINDPSAVPLSRTLDAFDPINAIPKMSVYVKSERRP
jgi:hypothetical protein